MLDSKKTAVVARIPGQMSLILFMAFQCERLYSRSDWQQESAATTFRARL
jgi:hypothetical protein